jgi:hypothetical protein
MADLVGSGWLIVAIIGLAVLLLNIGLLYGLRTGATQEQIGMIRKAFRRARNPWIDEDQSLSDLRRRVEAMGQRDESDDEQDG